MNKEVLIPLLIERLKMGLINEDQLPLFYKEEIMEKLTNEEVE